MYIRNYITPNNCKRCVKLRGLPYSAKEVDIAKFFSFQNFDVQEADVIMDMR